ncbi:hypothetical protein JCM10213_005136 [Rhodosporidiobolus nylandii]
MPVPSLPLELVSLVLTQLGASCDEDDQVQEAKSRRENGLSIALVCKAWRSLGEAFVWHDLVLDSPAATRRATQHFRVYPHHLQLVRDFVLRDGADPSADTAGGLLSSWRSQRPNPAEEIIALWSAGPVLKQLLFEAPSWVDHDQLLYAMLDLDNLQHLYGLALVLGQATDPTLENALILSYVSRLRHLRVLVLVLDFAGVRWITLPSIRPPSQLQPLSTLYLSLASQDSTDTRRKETFAYLLDFVRPPTLTSLALFLEPDDSAIVATLARFSNLAEIETWFDNVNRCGPLIQHLFAVLAALSPPHLSLGIKARPPEQRFPLPGFDTLPVLLGAIPSSVKSLKFNNVYLAATAASLPPVIADKPNEADVGTTLKVLLDLGDGEGPVEHVLVKLTDGSWRTVKSEKEGEAK